MAGNAANAAALPSYDGNAYWSNTSGNRSNADDTSINLQNGVGSYVNQYDVILAADPFTTQGIERFHAE